jgi:hypothetical protein
MLVQEIIGMQHKKLPVPAGIEMDSSPGFPMDSYTIYYILINFSEMMVQCHILSETPVNSLLSV